MVYWYDEHVGRLLWPLSSEGAILYDELVGYALWALSSEGAIYDFARQLVLELI